MTGNTMQFKQVMPVVKLGEKSTYYPWKSVPCTTLVVRMEDILREDGRTFKHIFEEISEAGGIHGFLGSPTRVMLSTIMRDKLIGGGTVDTYVEAIDVLKPDSFLTPDGETYIGETAKATEEIERMLAWSKEIIGKCKNSIPVGLVKGSDAFMVGEHTDALSQLGVNSMVFHIGDFLNRGRPVEASIARQYAGIIKNRGHGLYLYGIGAGKNLRRFFFADGFITQSHYVNAFYRQEYKNGKWHRTDKPPKDLVMGNLSGIYSQVRELEQESVYGGLSKWAMDSEEIENLTQERAKARSL